MKATCHKFVMAKGVAVVLGLGIVLGLVSLNTLPSFEDTNSWQFLLELLKVILVVTYMIVQTVCMGFGLVRVPLSLYLSSRDGYRRYIE